MIVLFIIRCCLIKLNIVWYFCEKGGRKNMVMIILDYFFFYYILGNKKKVYLKEFFELRFC